MTDDGYTAWLFVKKTDRWDDELRLPIIQSAYAREMGAEEDEIKVGIYDFSKGEQHLYHFTKSELEAAKGDLHRLLQRLKKMNKDDNGSPSQ
jgi:hypothetical protein